MIFDEHRYENIYKLLWGCYCATAYMLATPVQSLYSPADRLLVLYPEYQDVTIPYNVAPLNFLVRNEGVDAVCVSVKGSIGQLGDKCAQEQGDIPLEKAWRTLLEAEKEHTLEITGCRTDGRWLRYPSFAWQVVADKLDAYVSYRLIEPGYEVWIPCRYVNVVLRISKSVFWRITVRQTASA